MKVLLLLLVLLACFVSLSYSSFSSSGLSITFFIDPMFIPISGGTSTLSGNITFDVVSDGIYTYNDSHTSIAACGKVSQVTVNIPLGNGVFISTPSTTTTKPCIYYYDYQTLINIIFVHGNIIKINSITPSSNAFYLDNQDYSTYIKSVQNPVNNIGTLSDQYWNTNSLYGINQILKKWYYKSFEPTETVDGNQITYTIGKSSTTKPYIKVIGSITNQMNGFLNLATNSSIEYQMYHVNNTNDVSCNLLIPKSGGILIYIGTTDDDNNEKSHFAYYPYKIAQYNNKIQFGNNNIPTINK